MPWLGRPGRTPGSPPFTLVTPGPISSTCADASCPSRWGRNLSGPLAAAISLSCAPQIEVCSTLTRTWPTPSSSGKVISSTISGLRDSARIAAFAVLIFMTSTSFEEDEAVVAGVAPILVEPRPGLGCIEAVAGELPVQQIHLLALIAE